ncbi:MAG: hypothetical protein GC155_01945 [Alphaproteobacteria bacterium]|nr:hypothetical protein [Alphaproteobacteria bacterium]
MRLWIAMFGAFVVSGAAYADDHARKPGWAEIEAAAKACSVKIVRQTLPSGLAAIGHGPVYRLDDASTRAQRYCFYQRMNMSTVERLLREQEFAKSGSAVE